MADLDFKKCGLFQVVSPFWGLQTSSITGNNFEADDPGSPSPLPQGDRAGGGQGTRRPSGEDVTQLKIWRRSVETPGFGSQAR